MIILPRIGFPARDFLDTVSTVNSTGWYCCTPDVEGFAGVNYTLFKRWYLLL
jgi:hypothetical protein